MRLNLDCIRDILLCVESETDLHKYCIFYDLGTMQSVSDCLEDDDKCSVCDYQEELLSRYENDELFYHVRYCIESGLLSHLEGRPTYQFVITDLTPKGHDFIENIRNDNIFNGVKSIASKVGSKSLDAVISIASNVIIELIRAQFLPR